MTAYTIGRSTLFLLFCRSFRGYIKRSLCDFRQGCTYLYYYLWWPSNQLTGNRAEVFARFARSFAKCPGYVPFYMKLLYANTTTKRARELFSPLEALVNRLRTGNVMSLQVVLFLCEFPLKIMHVNPSHLSFIVYRLSTHVNDNTSNKKFYSFYCLSVRKGYMKESL